MVGKIWNKILEFNNLDDNKFDNSALSLKISDNYNLVVWCDIEKEYSKIFRYFIVSIRYNPYDDLFGDDIGVEYSTNNTTREELEKAIEYVLSYKKLEGIQIISKEPNKIN